jgi:hypothetical protein
MQKSGVNVCFRALGFYLRDKGMAQNSGHANGRNRRFSAGFVLGGGDRFPPDFGLSVARRETGIRDPQRVSNHRDHAQPGETMTLAGLV